MSLQVVSYAADDRTIVRFEVEPGDDWREASPDQVLGKIKEAVAPAVEGAVAVLDKVREAAPDEITVKFGIKVSGTATWFIARAATEGNFEIELKWTRGDAPDES